ncbi:MAG: DEAD/DEAH box helicase [Pseudomonadota bacterium]|nr:DEAD/DEAH box helicase [Pseudomonadota bacterium]
MTFESMDMPVVLKNGLDKLKLVQPTPIQGKAIPVALEGKDVVGSAQTGSGKTLAFLLPMLTHLLKADNKVSKALVITPTRELAQQVMTQIQALLKEGLFLKVALLIGGDSMFKQLKQLKVSPKVIVGTPGRINDHLRRGSLDLKRCDFVVLDETDRMLDMGFSVQIDAILEQACDSRQTLMFSATFPEEIKRISNRYLRDPVNVTMDQTFMPAKEITQDTVMIAEKDKYDKLLESLEKRQGSVIIFMKTKFSTERMAKRLTKEGHRSDAIHGDLRQSRRTKVIESFRKEKFRVLVATDVAARGLDIPHIEHVVNFDLPQCPEDYIHRIGRTGRNGASGFAMNLVSPVDRKRWQAISILLNPNAKPSGSKNQKRSQSNSRSRKPSAQTRFGGMGAQQPSSKSSRFKDHKRDVSDRSSRNRNVGKKDFLRVDDQIGNRISETGNSTNQRFSGDDQFNKKDYAKRGEGRRRQGGNNADRASRFDNSSKQGFSKKSRAGNGGGKLQSGNSFDRSSRNGNSFSEGGDDRFQNGNRKEGSRYLSFKKHDKGNKDGTFNSGNSNERPFRNSDSLKKKNHGGFSQKKRSDSGFKDGERRGASSKRNVKKGAPIYIKPHVKSDKKSKRETEEVVAVS